ncbi:MAG TPA: UDP-N-acetylmuramate--L-alanine ligase [Candidatus Paceibacterota bacterium]
MIDLNKIKSVYFIGIGGSGMSCVANMMIAKNKIVSGSDRELSLTTRELEEKGASIFYEQNGTHISKDIDLVIYTVAIPKNNPELVRANELGTLLLSYPQVLDLVSRNMITIGVAGTHGKTTTTAMLSHILQDTNISPTVIVGSTLVDRKTNFIEGAGEYFLVEADEYKKSFLNLNPKYLVITNIDEDHLDFYKDLKDIQNTFRELVAKVPADGFVVCNKTHPHLQPVIKDASCKILDYADTFPLDAGLFLPGIHNRQNASAAFTTASLFGISSKVIIEKLKSFKGVRRRFEYKGKTKQGALVYDDYAHNPQKVFAALQGAKEAFPDSRIIAVFQPHLYSRTKLLLDKFGKSFGSADRVLLAPIYAAREEFDGSISSEILARELQNNNVQAKDFESIDEIKDELGGLLKNNDVVVILGAGDIIKLSENLVS